MQFPMMHPAMPCTAAAAAAAAASSAARDHISSPDRLRSLKSYICIGTGLVRPAKPQGVGKGAMSVKCEMN